MESQVLKVRQVWLGLQGPQGLEEQGVPLGWMESQGILGSQVSMVLRVTQGYQDQKVILGWEEPLVFAVLLAL